MAISAEQWNTMDHDKRRELARRHLSRKLSARIGLGLEDLPDTCEISIDNWWDEDMTLEETLTTLNEASDEICSDIEINGIMSDFF